MKSGVLRGDRQPHGAGDWKATGCDRRRFLSHAAALGGGGLLSLHHPLAAADPPPETTRLRILEGMVTCIAPTIITEHLLRAEGFTDIQYVKYPSQTRNWPPDDLIAGEVDMNVSFIPTDILHVDAGAPLVILGGSHVGCVDVVASKRVKSTRDLKGRTVAIDTDTKVFISMFAAYVGLDPQKDINWSVQSWQDWPRLLEEGKIDAFMTGPPLSVELRQKKVGHVLVNTTFDKPWSQNFCCLYTSTREFVRKHPVAAKRALRRLMTTSSSSNGTPSKALRPGYCDAGRFWLFSLGL
jgi:NitT/TauT family transport system substrate-binding protein